jgi:hypothetical protein
MEGIRRISWNPKVRFQIRQKKTAALLPVPDVPVAHLHTINLQAAL